VRKKEDSGGTSPDRVYAAKKMKSPGPMLASDVTPCFSLGARPGACHPISCHRLARESHLEPRRQVLSSHGGGWWLGVEKKPRDKGDGCKMIGE
jgi:hypothetical protein